MTRIRTVLAGLGAVVMAYAIWGGLTDPDVRLPGVLIFLVAVLVAHDAVWMPAVLLVVSLFSRRPPWRAGRKKSATSGGGGSGRADG